MNVRLAKQIEEWAKFWATVTDPSQIERQLARLRWLADFAFHAGGAVDREQHEAVQLQIEAGEKKLAELGGYLAMTACPKTSREASPELLENALPRQVETSCPQRFISEPEGACD